MTSEHRVEEFVRRAKPRVTTTVEMDKRILDGSFAAVDRATRRGSADAGPNIWRSIMKDKRYKLAAAAVITGAILVGSLLLFDHGGPRAFGQVIEKVRSADSVSFLSRQKIGNQPVLVFRMYLQGDKVRCDLVEMKGQAEEFEQSRAEMEKGKIDAFETFVADFTRKQVLELDHVRKNFKKFELSSEVAAAFAGVNLLEQFRQVKPDDAKWIEEQSQDGRRIDVYLITPADFIGIKAILSGVEAQRMTLWVDRPTGLPVKILIEASLHVDGQRTDWFNFSDFAWNEPLDPKMLELEPPGGYTPKQE
ncbi:MAG: hypothetical protein JSU94_13040 [Phycisphaerales bacterium]|nr:MAG: hypothetical protein JSU94_13040 [Phycisphaerales bacterium]